MPFLTKKNYFWISLIIIILDQVSKYIISSNLTVFDKKIIIKNFFQIVYVHNSGAIWGIFSGSQNGPIPKIITVLAILALAIIVFLFIKMKGYTRFELLALSFIIGGALGNIIDRIKQGYVIDFLDFFIKDYHWPTFNVADSFIFIGVVSLIVVSFTKKKPLKDEDKNDSNPD